MVSLKSFAERLISDDEIIIYQVIATCMEKVHHFFEETFCKGLKQFLKSNGLKVLLPEVKSRTQGSRPRPRTLKNFEAKDRPSRGQGQGPRTQTQVFLKKTVLKIFFQVISKKGLQKLF